ncbi:MAG: hypothetical protein Q4C70_07790, partial [Planctomycetia bacterium]|nr:hypothetical protein [Planctomycetia bacterium]
DTTPETDTEVTSENTHTSAFTDLTDRPAGDFLMGAGIAPNVYFESWDVKEERFLFQRDGKRFSFQNADFLRWGNPADFSATESCLILSDGSIFAGIPIKTGTEAEIVMERKLITESVIERKTELLHWENTLFGSISFPVTEVAGILFHTRMPREREPFLRELEHFRAASSLEDLLIFRTGERLTGEFISITDDVLYFRTRALSPTSSAETFLPASQELEISLSQLVALFLTPELGGEFSELHGEISPETYFWIGLSDGSLFRLNPAGNRPALSEIPPETIQYLESPQHSQHFLDTSATAITSATAPIPELRWLDEIPPTQNSENHYAPSISSGNHHRWSVSSENYYPRLTVSGNRLRAGGKIYRHGLCLPAGTALLWKLDEAYSTLGLIPALPSDASLSETPFHLRIFSGENLVYEASFSSENTEKTLKLIRIPLNNTQELRLETSPLALPSSILLLDAFLIP